jgi:hypothetical protein
VLPDELDEELLVPPSAVHTPFTHVSPEGHTTWSHVVGTQYPPTH